MASCWPAKAGWRYKKLMKENASWLQRTTSDFVLFAMAFIGFVVGVTGMIITSVPVAVFGSLLLLLAVSGFTLKD